ncbi:serine/threonine protein kinase [Ilyonectria sp. MPI-CAGE-AT-0026]|nr:serine/threonine protein kinase [Ilyonectria sp. MPI-CAGE-AT-0026]
MTSQGAATEVAQNEEEEVQDIEEGISSYRPGHFHPVYIGDVYHEKYQVLNNIGYGQYSTVWLVQNISTLDADADDDNCKYFALKVLSAEAYHSEKPIQEREILKHLRDCNRLNRGYKYICHLVDDFEHSGPNGIHVCLVFDLMGETLSSFGTLFKGDMIPNPVMKKFTIQLLAALDYAHEATSSILFNILTLIDIKPDNIFVKFRDPSLIETGYLKQVPVPEQDKNGDAYTIVPSQPLNGFYFNPTDSPMGFDISLGDWEVLIGAPWNETTDWWNLGAVILEVFRAVRMFSGRVDPDGHYEVKEHLREIVDFFGPFPRALLNKGSPEMTVYFDATGNIKDAPPMDRPTLGSDEFMEDLSEEPRQKFVSFLHALMKIDPEARLSTNDLLRHPWLGLLPVTADANAVGEVTAEQRPSNQV